MKNELLVGIHVHRRGEIGPFSKKYIKILEENGISWKKMDIDDASFWDDLKQCTHFIYHWGGYPEHHLIARSIIPIIENVYKIPVFPNMVTAWHHDDKIREYYLMKSMGFPIIDSWIFYEKSRALQWLKNDAKYPLVFKLKSSAGSKDVVLTKDYPLASSITKKMFGSGVYLGNVPGNFMLKIKDFKWHNFIDQVLKKSYRIYKGRDISLQWQKEKNYVLFQKFLPDNNYDTRITVIGNRAFAFRRFNRDNDFRSSGSGKINYDIDSIDRRFLKIAFEISKKMGFQSMAYDFLLDNDKPAFCEISYTYQDKAIHSCPGYWDNELKWHEGNFWPQYFHLVDLLYNNDLKQPEFE
jgi:glutathione synthase/RimK-type ligase-like ATP-grasp enzyme